MKKTLVLSGGGIYGFIHLGALQYLADVQILNTIEKFIGTSIGGIISYLLIIGYSPIEICLHLIRTECLDRFDHFNVVNLFHGKGGALSFDIIHNTLYDMTLLKLSKIPTMSELPGLCHGKELIVCTYNFTMKREELLSASSHPDLCCLNALRMTSNLPFLFEPFEHNEQMYFDGALGSNFPLHAIDISNDVYFGIYIRQKYKDSIFSTDETSKIAMFDLIWQIVKIPMIQLQELKNSSFLEYGHVLCIDIENYASWHFRLQKSEILDLFSIGYDNIKNNNDTTAFLSSSFST